MLPENYITPEAFDLLGENTNGIVIQWEPLTATACTYDKDEQPVGSEEKDPCSHICISITREGNPVPLTEEELHEIYQAAGMDFDLSQMDDLTDPDLYAEKVVEYGTDDPYYYYKDDNGGNMCLSIVFKLVQDTYDI